VALDEIKARGIKWVIAANGNYRVEIEKRLRDVGSDAAVLTAEEILRLEL